jgi:tight adherence protein B
MSATTLAVIGVLVLVAVLFFGQFVYWTAQGRRQARERELARRLGTLREGEAGADEEAGLLRERMPAEGLVGQVEALVRGWGAEVDGAALLRRCATFAGVGALALLVVLRGPLGLLGITAGALPLVGAYRTANARTARIGEQLPDALDLLARSLQAGHGLVEALRAVAEEVAAPLGPEFGRAWEEQNLGRDLRDVLGDLCRRNPRVFDLRIFASAVLLQRDTGGNLVEILGNLSRMLRERATFRGRVRALTAEARFTGWILGGLPFAVGGLILLVQPGYLRPLVEDPLGRWMLAGCVTGLVTGGVLMRRAATVEA